MKTVRVPDWPYHSTKDCATMRRLGVTYSQGHEAMEITKRKRRTANRMIAEELDRGRSVESVIDGGLTDLAAENGCETTLSGYIAINWMVDYLKEHPEESQGWKPQHYKWGPLRAIRNECRDLDGIYKCYRGDIDGFVELFAARRWTLRRTNGRSYLVLIDGEYTPDEETMAILNISEMPEGCGIWLDNPVADSLDPASRLYRVVMDGRTVHRSTDPRMPRDTPEMPITEKYGLVYSRILQGREAYSRERGEAERIIENGLAMGRSTDSLVFNDLSMHVGDLNGVICDIVAEQWMVDYLARNPGRHDMWFPEGYEAEMGPLMREWAYADLIYETYHDEIVQVTTELGPQRWDLTVQGGNCFLVLYKEGMNEDRSLLRRFRLQDHGDVYALWLDNPFRDLELDCF